SVAVANAQVRGATTAYVEAASGDALTFAEYEDTSTRLAAALVARGEAEGWARGDRIGMQCPDGPYSHALLLACEKAGFVGVGIGSRAGTRERDHLLARTNARTLITDARALEASAPDDAPALEPIGATDLWFLNSTSGTTGLPKCVMHDQA